MPSCIDLHAWFGACYRIRREADGTTWYATPDLERVWLLELPCRYGVVYPYGGDLLAAAVTSRRIGQRVAALPCIRSSRGDVEHVVTFHVDDAESVLGLLKPYRRRHLSPERRAQTAEHLARVRQERRQALSQSTRTGSESTQRPGTGNGRTLGADAGNFAELLFTPDIAGAADSADDADGSDDQPAAVALEEPSA